MENRIYNEKNGLWYEKQGDYYLPCLELSEEESKPIGIWGQRRLRYIKQHKRVFYANLLTACKLNSYLADVDEQAEDMFSRLVKELAEKENVTEKLKAENAMLWVQRMNNIRNRATEIVNAEVIYSFSDSIKQSEAPSKDIQIRAIGRWGRLHLDYIKGNCPQLLDSLLKTNRIYQYLEEIECLAQSKYEKIEYEYQKVGYAVSNLIAEEIVLQDIIYNC